MDLITTHVNADFDALGALVAAKKLYPDSRLLMPGSQEEAVREFMALAKELVTIESEKECDLNDIDRLILVDTRHRSRIGKAAELVDRGVEIHVYDHHPRMKGDVVADKDVYEEVGASVTILAEIIKTRKIKLTYLEATIMLLGIYEETGSLTYRSTTKRDVDMVSFLLSQGANLSVVSKYLNRELKESELPILTGLINSTRRISIKGISVSIIEMDKVGYIGELGKLIQKLMEIENISVLFVLVKMPNNRVDIVARSNMQGVDVNKILSRFGGGGHPAAASAKVRRQEIAAVKEKLLAVLQSNIKIRVCAKDIMTKDIRTMDIDTKIGQAKKFLAKNGLSGMPVRDGDEVAGIITVDDLNKAIKRGFGHSRIKGYMSGKMATAKTNTPINVIQKIVLENNVGIVPVFDGSVLAGVIDRTAVLRNVHDELFVKPHAVNRKVVFNLSKKMSKLLPKGIMRLLKKIGEYSDSFGYSAFVVGGLVRDLLLGVKNLDLDIVIEGDAIKLGHELSCKMRAALVVHRRFGTCSVISAEGLKIDLATARKEIYERPAALPTVEFSSLKNDLIRRDFTINAMAISINHENFGQLIDFFAGEKDLMRGRIKIMHDGSFIDDPTRIFRAVRFEQRFDFSIDAHTEDLIKHAIEKEMFDKVAPQRIRDELILILKEREPIRALKRMAELDELRFLHPKMKFDKNMMKFCGRIEKICRWYEDSTFKKRCVERWLMYLMALCDGLSYKEVSGICDRFVFRRGEKIRILSYKKRARQIVEKLGSAKALAPSKIYRLLEPLAFEVTLMMLAKAGLLSDKKAARTRAQIKDFFQKYNGLKTHTKGRDLEKLGLKPSPKFSSILKKILYARIDGKVYTKKEELSYAGKLAEIK